MARILIVDDERFMRLTLRRSLEMNGHEVVGEAGNGFEAIIQYSSLKPDVVTMDITMPEMDGIDAVEKICSQFPEAKIIMCSAMGQTQMVTQALKNGAKDFIVKPFNPERVEMALAKVLQD
ncbi:MAG: two-component system response regulator [Gracilibacter sp. BRH_c7a]|nr:MAG: two-component system response regulator [Gracilibacter sp. BRH_c7a]